VSFAIGPQESLGGDVSVLLGGREGGVTEKLLNGAEVCPRIEKMSGKGMPESMGRHLSFDGTGTDMPVYNPANAPHIEGSAPEIQEQSVLPCPRARFQGRS
jgi:hypothetical protein